MTTVADYGLYRIEFWNTDDGGKEKVRKDQRSESRPKGRSQASGDVQSELVTWPSVRANIQQTHYRLTTLVVGSFYFSSSYHDHDA